MSNDDLMILKVLSRLNGTQARLYVAKEAICRGRGGIQRMQELTGLSRPTILKGMSELRQQEPADPTEDIRQLGGRRESSEESSLTSTTRRPGRQYGAKRCRIRRPGGGRKLIEEVDPAIVPALERLLADEIAGGWATCRCRVAGFLFLWHVSERLYTYRQSAVQKGNPYA
jgi:hypothetical protein